MTEIAAQVVIVRISECESTGRRISTRLWAAGRKWVAVANSLRIGCAAEGARPINPVGLHRIGAHFHQSRLDHYLASRLIDLHQHFANIVDVAARLSEENRVGALVDLRWIFARQL